MASNVPLTIQTVLFGNNVCEFVVGNQRYYAPSPNSNYLQNSYWAMVLDRSTLAPQENIIFSDNQNIPAQLSKYMNNSKYLLLLTTSQLHSNNLPAGNLYNFLTSLGASTELQRLEQIYAALNCGTWGNMCYTLVAVFDGSVGIEYGNIHNTTVETLQLIPVSIGSSVLYTPVRL